jgi:glycerate dehydrogenase
MSKSGIVFLDADTVGETDFSPLACLGHLTLYHSTLPEQRILHIADNEIVITNKVVIDSSIMDACPGLKLICIAATGMNNIDLEYAAVKEITVKNVSGYSTESVVQHTFAMLFYLLEKLPYYDNFVKTGDYARGNLFTHHGMPFQELSAKKYGVIGLGTIGKRVARVAESFGCEVLYYSTSQKNKDKEYRNVSLQILLNECDFISIHCPLNESTRNLIGYEQLSSMKRGALLINAGRGGIVDEGALARALNEELIAGAGLDVLEKEPPDTVNPLFRIKDPAKLFITPHIAWASKESRERLIEGIAGNIESYLTRGIS